MGQISVTSNLLQGSFPIKYGNFYYLLLVSNTNNEILMNVLNATEFYNLTNKEIKIFTEQNNDFVLKNTLKCDKFYWYNSDYTQLRYDYLLLPGDIITFSATVNGNITIPNINSGIILKNYNTIKIWSVGLGQLSAGI